MLIAIDNPVGIDAQVVKLQEKINSSLTTKWGIVDSQYKCYGRAYKYKADDGYTAKVYDSSTGDYVDVYFDDSVSAVSFVSVADKVNIEKGQGHTQCALIFFVNLSKVKPTITHRADEEVRRDVIKLVGWASYGFAVTGEETGIENVLREYPGLRRDKKLTNLDLQPLHAFRINLNLIYQL